MSTELGDTGETAIQRPARVHINWREITLLGVLAYGLGFLFLPYLGTLLTRSTRPTNLMVQADVAVVLGMFPPLVAALIMRIFVSKEGIKGSLGLFRSWKYYLAALILPAVFATAVVVIVQALGLGEFGWSEVGWLVYPTLLLRTLPNRPVHFGRRVPLAGLPLATATAAGRDQVYDAGRVNLRGVARAAVAGRPQLSGCEFLTGLSNLLVHNNSAFVRLHLVLRSLKRQRADRGAAAPKQQHVLGHLLATAAYV